MDRPGPDRELSWGEQWRAVREPRYSLASQVENDGVSNGKDCQASIDISAADDELSLARRSWWRAVHERIWGSGSICVAIAAFLFSVSVLCYKLTGGRVPVLEVTLARSGPSLLVSICVARAHGITPVFGAREHLPWLLLRGTVGATAMLLYYYSLAALPIADAVVIFFLNPMLTAVLAWAIRGEPLGLLGMAGCCISVVGLVFVAHPPFLFGGHQQWGPVRIFGTAAGLGSALCAAGAFILIRHIGQRVPALVIAIHFHSMTVIGSSLPLALGWPRPAVLPGVSDACLLGGVAATSFCGQLLLTRGFQLDTASRASSINFTQVVWSYIFGVTLLGEQFSLMGVLGSLLIALGLVAVNTKAGPGHGPRPDTTARDAANAGTGSMALRAAAPVGGAGVAPAPPTYGAQHTHRAAGAAGAGPGVWHGAGGFGKAGVAAGASVQLSEGGAGLGRLGASWGAGSRGGGAGHGQGMGAGYGHELRRCDAPESGAGGQGGCQDGGRKSAERRPLMLGQDGSSSSSWAAVAAHDPGAADLGVAGSDQGDMGALEGAESIQHGWHIGKAGPERNSR